MPAPCLACVVCGRPLENVFDGATNQPNTGLSFTTHGAYGSTFFDPMDGSYLELNICDSCVRQASLKGRVYRGQARRPVRSVVGGLKHPSVVGMQDIPHGEQTLVLYDPTADHEDTGVVIPASEVGSPAIRGVEWSPGLEKGWPPQ